MSTSPFAELLTYTSHGWPVFPVYEPRDGRCSCGAADCESQGKHPRIKGWQTAATTDVAQIERWAAQFPGCNWGMPTGPASGVDVLDEDPRHDGDKTLRDFEAVNGTLPETVRVLTQSDGTHRLFRSDPAHVVKNGTNVLGPGIDVRGEGGFVVIPPSVGLTGRPYRFDLAAHPDDVQVADWTEPLLKRVNGAAPGGTPAPRLDVPSVLAGVPEGHREEMLFKLACKLRRADVPEDAALDLVLKAAAKAVPPFPADEAAERLRRAYRTYQAGSEPFVLKVSSPLTDDQEKGLAMARGSSAPRNRETWTPATLEGVTDPNVGHVEYIVDRLIPRGEVVGIAATFKSGKSLAFYSLLLSALRGERVFGTFMVPRPLRVVVFQEEMPSREDNRRLRRLALGMGLDPADLLAFVASGQLVFYNRVGLDLSTVEGVALFHDAIRAADADLVILDSLIAAAGAVELEKNGPVRRMFTAAFLPLTTEGRSIVFLHHKRKGQQGARGRDADRDSFLGAQAIAAASGRMYSLERLDEPEDAPKDPTRFRCVLTLFGSWTPEEAVSTVLETRDNGEGTTVTALDDTAQVRAGGVNAKQRAALALAKIVGIRRTVNRKALFEEVASDLSVTTRTVEGGFTYAKAHGWIETESAGKSKNEMNVVPGERLGDAC